MVVLTDTEGYITYVNPAFERCTGYTAAEVIGHTPKIVKSGEHDAEYYAEMWLAITSGKVWRDGFKNRRKDGSIYQVSQSIFPVVDASGAVIAYAAVQQDVTERKRMEEKLRHTDRVESLGVLAGGIAHDFNNLLTSILGHASLAKEKSDTSSPVWHHLERIEQASLSSADLCRQMLAYSGKGKFVVQPVDLSRLIETMGKLVEVSVSKKIGIRYMLSDQLPLIEADVAQMQQVVLNLLTNASEAIGEQYGSITVSTGQLAVDTDYLEECLGHEHIQAGDFVYLEVIDSGCGMSRETQGKIFDPFFTTKMTGRGLGMSAMLGIVRGHRGVLRISSESGQGTSIRVLIPATGEQSRVVAAELPEDIPMKSGTVLVIDDEEVVREIAQTMLEGMGYGVLKACDGIEGLEQFEEFKERISFVLLDMTMPKMSGLECFAELRRLDPDVRVILSSGYTEQ
ncbi:MAG: histidine kinase, partial [Zetaproteobacteria bacterium CG_4_8_14_3_um_filter_59_5]